MFNSKYLNILIIFFIVFLLFILLKIYKDIKLDEYINNLSPEYKIGQLLMIAPEGTTFDNKLKKLFKECHIGNLKIYGKNYKNKKQLRKLIVDAQNYALKENNIPLFIATDQEGGWVAHLKKGFTIPPGEMGLGKSKNPQLAYIAGYIIATELNAIGINVNFAPVVDLDFKNKNWVIGPRAYSSKPYIVVKFANEFIKAHNEFNILTVLKHFPGQGRINRDSHISLLTNKAPYSILIKKELLPFLLLSNSFESSIMLGHIATPGIITFLSKHYKKSYKKSEYYVPASISYPIIHNYIRHYLNYKGLLFTDEMSMKGLLKYTSLKNAVYQALKAGVNIVLINANYTKIKDIYSFLLNKYIKEKDFQNSVNSSIKKIILYKNIIFHKKNKSRYFSKEIFHIDKLQYNFKNLSIINSKYLKKLAFEISLLTTEIYKNKKNIIPLPKYLRDKNIIVISPRESLYYFMKEYVYYKNITYIKIPAGFTKRISSSMINNILKKIDSSSLIFFGIVSQENEKLCKIIYNRKNKNIIVINMLHPYNVYNLKNIDTIINTYSDNPVQIHAALEIIFNGTRKEKININSLSLF